jgi:hypothetical protein
LLDRLQQAHLLDAIEIKFVAGETIAAGFRVKKQSALHGQATLFLPT